jgi:hypothetical protein
MGEGEYEFIVVFSFQLRSYNIPPGIHVYYTGVSVTVESVQRALVYVLEKQHWSLWLWRLSKPHRVNRRIREAVKPAGKDLWKSVANMLLDRRRVSAFLVRDGEGCEKSCTHRSSNKNVLIRLVLQDILDYYRVNASMEGIGVLGELESRTVPGMINSRS